MNASNRGRIIFEAIRCANIQSWPIVDFFQKRFFGPFLDSPKFYEEIRVLEIF